MFDDLAPEASENIRTFPITSVRNNRSSRIAPSLTKGKLMKETKFILLVLVLSALVWTGWALADLPLSVKTQHNSLRIKKGKMPAKSIQKMVPLVPSYSPVAVRDTLLQTVSKGQIAAERVIVDGRVATIRGQISPQTRNPYLQIGEHRQDLAVDRQGGFEQAIILSGTQDVVLMDGEDELDRIQLTSQAPSVPFRVMLSWAADRADLDLYVFLPDQACIWYQNPRNHHAFLDVDDTNGYGPEHISLTQPLSGTFRIFTHYYNSHGLSGPVPFSVKVFLGERLVKMYEGALNRANSATHGPGNSGDRASWRFIGDFSL